MPAPRKLESLRGLKLKDFRDICANRSLAGYVTAIAASFEETKLLTGRALAKARVTGNPVRDQVVDWATQSYRPQEPDNHRDPPSCPRGAIA